MAEGLLPHKNVGDLVNDYKGPINLSPRASSSPGSSRPGRAGNCPAVDAGRHPAGHFYSPKLRVLDLFSGYTIREDGEVRSRFGRVIRQQFDGPGYARVELWQNGKGKKYLVHRLLAQAFIPNPDGKPQVNHIDGDKKNNALANLEWVTQSENQRHAYRIGLQVGYRKPMPLSEKHKRALCGSRWRNERREYIAAGMTFQTPEDAAAFHKVSRQTVYNRAASPRFPDWEIKTWREVK